MQGSTVLQLKGWTRFSDVLFSQHIHARFQYLLDTSFLMENSKKVEKKQKWRLLKLKSRHFKQLQK